MAVSMEIRRLAVKAYKDGFGCYEHVAGMFEIGSASLKRWVSRERRTGSIERLPRGGGVTRKIDEAGASFISESLNQRPDMGLEELQRAYNAKFSTSVSVSTIGRCVRNRLRFRRKKSRTDQPSRIPPRSK